jgi:hypothetical protein
MRSSGRYRWVGPATAAIAALLALGWCAPSRVLASCGDYVTTASERGHSAHHASPPSAPSELPPLVVFDLTSRPGDREAMSLSLGSPYVVREPARPTPCQQCPLQPKNAPCQGPWCSGNPAPMPLPTTVEPVEDHWACCSAEGILCSGEQIGLQMLDDQQDRIHHVFPTFHPPRPA